MKGHNVADALSEDYAASMDMDNGSVRPLFHCDQVSLIETNTTDTQRTNDGYQKTGDLITLPYTEEVFIENSSATKSVNINPFASSTHIGGLTLQPELDEWKDINTRPDLVINNENLFDAVKDIPNPGHALGTTWNEWQVNWTGKFNESTTSGGIETIKKGRTGKATRTGISRTLSSKVVKQNFGERVVDMSYVPFIRKNVIEFQAVGLKPNIRVYPFFDEVDISSYVTPTGGSLGGSLIADSNGFVSGEFEIPRPDVSTNPRWRCGERNFRLTSSSTNSALDNDVDSFAETKYIARGLQMTRQNSVYSTRVPHVLSTTVSDTEARRTVDSTTTINHNPARNYSGGSKGNQGTTNGLNDEEYRRQVAAGTYGKKKNNTFKGHNHPGGNPHYDPPQKSYSGNPFTTNKAYSSPAKFRHHAL